MKYDRPGLKAEYMSWMGNDRDEAGLFVLEWLRTKKMLGRSGNVDGTIQKKTKGRQIEKVAMREKAQEKAMKETEKKLAKLYQPSAEELHEMKKTIINLTKARMQQLHDKFKKGDDVNPRDLEIMRRMTKTEMLEPTVVTKNINQNTEAIELSDEDKQAINSLLANNL